jgi:hypothetical protein
MMREISKAVRRLVVNVKIARALGLAVSPSIMLRATEVID